MELSPCWETASLSATQQFPNILGNPGIHYDVEKSHTLIFIMILILNRKNKLKT
jgi:hypothetical protein